MPTDQPPGIVPTCRALSALLAAVQAEAERRGPGADAAVRDHLRTAHDALQRALETFARIPRNSES